MYPVLSCSEKYYGDLDPKARAKLAKKLNN